MQTTGILKTWIEARSFGFFSTGDGDVFVHLNDFNAAHLTPEVRKQYRFRVVTNPRNGKPMATDIEEITGDSKKHEVDLAWLQHTSNRDAG